MPLGVTHDLNSEHLRVLSRRHNKNVITFSNVFHSQTKQRRRKGISNTYNRVIERGVVYVYVYIYIYLYICVFGNLTIRIYIYRAKSVAIINAKRETIKNRTTLICPCLDYKYVWNAVE